MSAATACTLRVIDQIIMRKFGSRLCKTCRFTPILGGKFSAKMNSALALTPLGRKRPIDVTRGPVTIDRLTFRNIPQNFVFEAPFVAEIQRAGL